MEDWIFIQNPIEHATEGSFAKSMIVSTFHDSALLAGSSIPFVHLLYESYHPIHLILKADFKAWDIQEHAQEGKSLTLEQLFVLLRGNKIRKWDVSIQNEYEKGSERYVALLPDGRGPFQTGSQQSIIDAVETLSGAIGTDAALASTKADVDAFLVLLDEANTTQKGSKKDTSTLSQKLEISRINMCIAQYGNLGMFINQYKATPQLIPPFFDLVNIRQHHQVMFTGHIKPLSYRVICKHTFGEKDLVKIINMGNTDLIFYLAQMKQHKLPTIPHVFPSLSTTTDLASILGSLNNKFIIVYNPSETEMGAYDFEIL